MTLSTATESITAGTPILVLEKLDKR